MEHGHILSKTAQWLQSKLHTATLYWSYLLMIESMWSNIFSLSICFAAPKQWWFTSAWVTFTTERAAILWREVSTQSTGAHDTRHGNDGPMAAFQLWMGGVRGVEIHPVSSVSKTWCLSHPAVHSHGIHPGELHMQIIFPWHGHHCVCLKRFRGFHMSSTTAKVQSKCACISNMRMTMVITSQHQSFAKFLAASIAKLAPMSKPHLGGQWRPWVQDSMFRHFIEMRRIFVCSFAHVQINSPRASMERMKGMICLWNCSHPTSPLSGLLFEGLRVAGSVWLMMTILLLQYWSCLALSFKWIFLWTLWAPQVCILRNRCYTYKSWLNTTYESYTIIYRKYKHVLFQEQQGTVIWQIHWSSLLLIREDPSTTLIWESKHDHAWPTSLLPRHRPS